MMSKRNKILTPPAFHLSDMKLRILKIVKNCSIKIEIYVCKKHFLKTLSVSRAT